MFEIDREPLCWETLSILYGKMSSIGQVKSFVKADIRPSDLFHPHFPISASLVRLNKVIRRNLALKKLQK